MSPPAPDIPKLVECEDIPGLVSFLEDEDWELAESVARSLAQFAQDGRALDLVEAGVVPLLLKRLQDPSVEDQTFFLLALAMVARWGGALSVVENGAIPVFMNYLDGHHPFWIRGAAVKALVAIAKGDQEDALTEAGVLNLLLPFLDQDPPALRALVVMALGELGDNDAVEALKAYQERENDEVLRNAASRATRKIEGPNPLMVHLESLEPLTRRTALVALAETGDLRDLQLLELFLGLEKDPEVRLVAEQALEKLRLNIPLGESLRREAEKLLKRLGKP